MDPPANSKQTFPKTKLYSAGRSLPGQVSEFPSADRNPAEIHKKITIRRHMSLVIAMYGAKAHSAAWTVARSATEQDHILVPHGNKGGFFRKTCA